MDGWSKLTSVALNVAASLFASETPKEFDWLFMQFGDTFQLWLSVIYKAKIKNNEFSPTDCTKNSQQYCWAEYNPVNLSHHFKSRLASILCYLVCPDKGIERTAECCSMPSNQATTSQIIWWQTFYDKMAQGNKKSIVHAVENKLQKQEAKNNALTSEVKHTKERDFRLAVVT